MNMQFDINSDEHWKQIENGLRQHVRTPIRSAPFLLQLLQMVRQLLTGGAAPVAASGDQDGLKELMLKQGKLLTEQLSMIEAHSARIATLESQLAEAKTATDSVEEKKPRTRKPTKSTPKK